MIIKIQLARFAILIEQSEFKKAEINPLLIINYKNQNNTELQVDHQFWLTFWAQKMKHFNL